MSGHLSECGEARDLPCRTFKLPERIPNHEKESWIGLPNILSDNADAEPSTRLSAKVYSETAVVF